MSQQEEEFVCARDRFGLRHNIQFVVDRQGAIDELCKARSATQREQEHTEWKQGVESHLDDLVRVIRVDVGAVGSTVKHLEISLVLINRLPLCSLSLLEFRYDISLTSLA